jgi:hypothetical protein
MRHTFNILLAVLLLVAGACDGRPFEAEAGTPSGEPQADQTLAADCPAAGAAADAAAADDLAGRIPERLSQTGLYQDIASGTLRSDIRSFEPAHALWADGARKRRFYRLPPCSRIDTSDMDHWSLPVGARFWKEFSVGGVRIETRFIARHGAGANDFILAAYQWLPDGSDAVHVPGGVQHAGGTAHDIPDVATCQSCHERLRERVLGFSAIQLSHEGPGDTLASLAARGVFTVAPPSGGYPVPGDPTTQQALGYLHANCGHCHSGEASGVTLGTPYQLRLSTAELASPEATATYRTAVGVPTDEFHAPGVTYRVTPGDPSASAIVHRMAARDAAAGGGVQMPPVGTDQVDAEGLALVERWIRSLPAGDGDVESAR